MSLLRLIISVIAIIASSEASGLGHLVPAVKSIPVVRYAPFYSFPAGVRSVHAVLPAIAPAPVVRAFAPAPVLPAPVAAPVLPAPPPLFPRVYPAPAFPAPAFPAPAFPAPAYPAPVLRTQFLPAPIPAPLPAPVVATAPAFAPAIPALPRFAPISAFHAAPFYARSVPFSPIVRPVAPAVLPAPAPVYPAPVFAPTSIGFARSEVYPAPAPILPAPIFKHEQAWK